MLAVRPKVEVLTHSLHRYEADPLRAFAVAEGRCGFSSGAFSFLSRPSARRRAAGLHQIPLYDYFEREVGLFTRHVQILSLVYRKSPIGILRLSRATGLPKHKVRYSLKILETEGLIKAKAAGAVPTKASESFMKDLQEMVTRFKTEFDTLEKSIEKDMKALKADERG